MWGGWLGSVLAGWERLLHQGILQEILCIYFLIFFCQIRPSLIFKKKTTVKKNHRWLEKFKMCNLLFRSKKLICIFLVFFLWHSPTVVQYSSFPQRYLLCPLSRTAMSYSVIRLKLVHQLGQWLCIQEVFAWGQFLKIQKKFIIVLEQSTELTA